MADRVRHRPLADILANLAEARVERDGADAELDEVLAGWGLYKATIAAASRTPAWWYTGSNTWREAYAAQGS